MIKAILFDADGMTITPKNIFSVQFGLDFKIPQEKILPFFQKEFQDCLTGKADLKKAIVPYLKQWHWYKSTDELLEYWFKSEHIINHRLINLVKKLRHKKGIKCYLAMNQEKYRDKYIRKKMDLEKAFDGIFSSVLIGFQKPAKEFFNYIMRYLKNIKKNEILSWDDKKEYVVAARKFGFKAEQYINYQQFIKSMKKYKFFV